MFTSSAPSEPARRRCEPPRTCLPQPQAQAARSILTALGVALAVGSFITLYGLSRSVQENVQQSFEERGTDLTVRRRGIAEPFGGTMPESIIPEIAKIPGVAAVSGQLLSFAATDNDDHVIAFGWASDSFYWATVPMLEGRLPQPGERKIAVIGKDIARTLDKHVGDDITLLGEKFRVIGISNYTSIINRNAVMVELADLQEITFRTGAVTFIAVKLAPPGGPERGRPRGQGHRGPGPALRDQERERAEERQPDRAVERGVDRHGLGGAAHGRADGAEHAAHGGARAHARDRHPVGHRLVQASGSWGRW